MAQGVLIIIDQACHVVMCLMLLQLAELAGPVQNRWHSCCVLSLPI